MVLSLHRTAINVYKSKRIVLAPLTKMRSLHIYKSKRLVFTTLTKTNVPTVQAIPEKTKAQVPIKIIVPVFTIPVSTNKAQVPIKIIVPVFTIPVSTNKSKQELQVVQVQVPISVTGKEIQVQLLVVPELVCQIEEPEHALQVLPEQALQVTVKMVHVPGKEIQVQLVVPELVCQNFTGTELISKVVLISTKLILTIVVLPLETTHFEIALAQTKVLTFNASYVYEHLAEREGEVLYKLKRCKLITVNEVFPFFDAGINIISEAAATSIDTIAFELDKLLDDARTRNRDEIEIIFLIIYLIFLLLSSVTMVTGTKAMTFFCHFGVVFDLLRFPCLIFSNSPVYWCVGDNAIYDAI